MKKGIESPLSLYKCYFAGQCCFACLHNLKINYFVVSLGHTNTITIIYLCFPDFLFCEKIEFKFQILVITKWAVKFMFKIWRLQKWVLPFNLPLYYRYKVQPNKSNNGEESHYNSNGEESHYKVQPNKSNNGLLHMPLHCILITIILPLPVLNQTLPLCLLRWLVCLELS
jgi:hypothetical protein